MRSQFTFYGSFWESVSRIRNKAARCDAYDAIVRYALTGEEPDLDGLPDAAAICFVAAKPNIDASRRKAENGKAGRPKTEQEPKDNRTETEPEPNTSQTESEKEGEKEIEIEIEDECPPLSVSPPKAKKRFVPPTLEEVEAYCRERNSPVDPRRFFEYFQAGGWKDSKGQPVRNWKQKLLTWEKYTDGPQRGRSFADMWREAAGE